MNAPFGWFAEFARAYARVFGWIAEPVFEGSSGHDLCARKPNSGRLEHAKRDRRREGGREREQSKSPDTRRF